MDERGGNRLPMMVVCRLIGVPDEDADRLAAWGGYASTQLLEGGLVGQEQLAAAGTAAMELAAYVATKFAQEDGNPRDTLLGDLATACATGELDVMTAQMMMITLFGAGGGESTASLIGSATSILATRPQVQRQLREKNPGLIPVFLEEVLRFEPPFRGHYRHVLRDCTLAGHDLPGGSRLILLWGAANRDPPAHFESPDELRLDRANGKGGHIAFGRGGAHFCVGAALARMEARIVLEHLLSQRRGSRWWKPADGCPACWCAASNASSWPSTSRYSANRPAKPRSGRSALVIRPGAARTTDSIELSAGIPVTVMPMDAKLAGSDRSTPGLGGKIMCLL